MEIQLRDQSLDSQTLRDRLAKLCVEGKAIADRFDAEVRRDEFHAFLPAKYLKVLRSLELLPTRGRFLEAGSATGIIAIMADLLGYEAYGIEIDASLVDTAKVLADRYESGARFAAGSFLPEGYEWVSETGDLRMGTIGFAESGYRELGLELADFDVVFAFPWPGEEALIHDLMARHGKPDAYLLLPHGGDGEIAVYRHGRREL